MTVMPCPELTNARQSVGSNRQYVDKNHTCVGGRIGLGFVILCLHQISVLSKGTIMHPVY